MAGIESYGAYIPLYRLSRAEIAREWNASPSGGEKAVANYDEDSITMAVAAAMDCITGFDPQTIDRLYFASTTSPYKEKQAAATVAGAMGLRREVLTADFSGSLRAGTNALTAAFDAVAAGTAKSVLVTCSETRLGAPRGDKELALGDGAAAVLVGDSNTVVSIEGYHAIFEEIFDVWRSDQDTFVRFWEDRFGREAGYVRVVPEVILAALKQYGLTSDDFSKAVLYAPNPRQLATVAKTIGFDVKTKVQDLLYNTVGDTGTAHPLLLLVAALEEAKAGDRILLASYGDGCDVFNMRVTENLAKLQTKRGVKRHLVSKVMLPSYVKYMLWRQIVPTETSTSSAPRPVSASALWRDRDWGLSLRGVRCKSCGTPQYPRQRVCVVCQAADNFDPYTFSDKKGRLTAFSHDRVVSGLDSPSTVAVVDFEGGGRIICNMTDRDPDQVKTGMPVEMTFRKLQYAEGIHNYWWKCAPIRC